MYLLRSVDVWSCAKVAGVFYGCMGLLLIPVVLIAVTASAGSTQPFSAIGATALILLSLFAPVFYGLLGLLIGALTAWIYNVAARNVGGIRLNLRSENGIESPAKHISVV